MVFVPVLLVNSGIPTLWVGFNICPLPLFGEFGENADPGGGAFEDQYAEGSRRQSVKVRDWLTASGGTVSAQERREGVCGYFSASFEALMCPTNHGRGVWYFFQSPRQLQMSLLGAKVFAHTVELRRLHGVN